MGDNSHTISYKEFRKGLKDHGYRSHDIQRLFYSLDIESRGQVRPEDLYFLDEWELADILNAQAIADFSDSDDDHDSSHSEDEDSDESASNQHRETLDSSKTKSSLPASTRRSTIPWPRINPQETTPNPSGKCSKLLAGSAPAPPQQVVKKDSRPLHVEILASLRARRVDDSLASTSRTQKISSSLANSLESHTGICGLLKHIGWRDAEQGPLDFHPISTATISDCDSQTWFGSCASPMASRCSSPSRQHYPPRSQSALGSSTGTACRALWE